MTSPVTSALTIRPRRIRRVCWVLAPAVVIFFVVLGVALGREGAVFRPSDQVAMMVLGLVGAGVILLFTRPQVSADADRIVIRNVIGGYDLPWAVVRVIRFEPGNSWATLELEDDEVVAVLAIQAADKEHAVAAIRQLRALHEDRRSE